MYEIEQHIVEYHEYCSRCKHKNTDAIKEPCNTCLEESVRDNSKRPLNFEESLSNYVRRKKRIKKNAGFNRIALRRMA